MRLQAGALHVWRADLDAFAGRADALLDREERRRATRIVRVQARTRWTSSRAVLRILLGAYTGTDPRALRFASSGQGKPSLGDRDGAGLHFNVSHSGALAIYAFTKMCAVGVDVEVCARDPRKPRRSSETLKSWVRYEARVKRLGIGVRNAPALARHAGPRPWIHDLDLGESSVGAVVLALPPVDFRVYEVDFQALIGERTITQ